MQGKSIMSNKQTMTVLVQDLDNKELLPRSVEVLYPTDLESLGSAMNLFVLTSATGLSEVADIVRDANQKHHLRVLFIKENIDSKWLPQMFDRANLRIMRNTMVYSNSNLPKRVIAAWSMGAQEQLIAEATVIGDRLLILSCSMEEFEVPFASMSVLNRIPLEERASFEIANDGGYIYWPSTDLHLDLDAFRCVTDSTWQQKCAAFKLTHDQQFGKAIATLRKKYKLRQADILGLSERQLRRIESGEGSTKIDTLNLLAKAHGLTLDTYLDEVANLISDIPEEFVLPPATDLELCRKLPDTPSKSFICQEN
jgi:transcriptional regulator with XRE-family HTH domain